MINNEILDGFLKKVKNEADIRTDADAGLFIQFERSMRNTL